MTNLEQLAALIELLDSPVHANAETHDSENGACTECPVPLFSRPPLEIAQAIIDAGWTPPVPEFQRKINQAIVNRAAAELGIIPHRFVIGVDQQTTPSYLEN